MSKRDELEEIRKLIKNIQARIGLEQIVLESLQRKACRLTAEVNIEAMPASIRNALVCSGMSTNPVPRKPVINERAAE